MAGQTQPMSTKLPTPEFVFTRTHWGMAYGWKCEAHGVMVFGDTAKECISSWKEAYTAETGLPVVEPPQGELFAA